MFVDMPDAKKEKTYLAHENAVFAVLTFRTLPDAGFI